MSKLRDPKSKIRDFKPRDPKGRFIKSIRKIPYDFFGDRKTPPTNLTQRYVRSESQRGHISTPKTTESQSATHVDETQFETVSEQEEDTQQSRPTVEQPIEYIPESDTVIEQIDIHNILQLFLKLHLKK